MGEASEVGFWRRRTTKDDVRPPEVTRANTREVIESLEHLSAQLNNATNQLNRAIGRPSGR